jgi:hypothetical protein
LEHDIRIAFCPDQFYPGAHPLPEKDFYQTLIYEKMKECEALKN